MVQQCADCKLWFRTENKFRNHKSEALGFSCSANETKPTSKEFVTKVDDDFVISPYKNSGEGDVDNTLSDMDDTEIISSDEEEEENEEVTSVELAPIEQKIYSAEKIGHTI